MTKAFFIKIFKAIERWSDSLDDDESYQRQLEGGRRNHIEFCRKRELEENQSNRTQILNKYRDME